MPHSVSTASSFSLHLASVQSPPHHPRTYSTPHLSKPTHWPIHIPSYSPTHLLTQSLAHSLLPQGKESYTLATLASDIKGSVHALGHSRCTLMAHDWGGSVAWVTAGMYATADATGGATAGATATAAHGLLDGLIVLGLPHTGISLTNMSSEQNKRSSYMLSFQVSLVGVRVVRRTTQRIEAKCDRSTSTQQPLPHSDVEGQVMPFRRSSLSLIHFH
jgi:pimeloyl-ACP methyl ester carboxylesterase